MNRAAILNLKGIVETIMETKPKPLEYELVDLLLEPGIGPEERRAVQTIVNFVCDRKREIASLEAENPALHYFGA